MSESQIACLVFYWIACIASYNRMMMMMMMMMMVMMMMIKMTMIS